MRCTSTHLKKKKGCQVDEVSNHHFYFSCLFVSKFVHEFMNIGSNGRLLFQQQQINKIICCSRLKRSKVWTSKNEHFFSPSSLLLMQYQKQTRNCVQKLFLLMIDLFPVLVLLRSIKLANKLVKTLCMGLSSLFFLVNWWKQKSMGQCSSHT